jgi:hypothetical protein
MRSLVTLTFGPSETISGNRTLFGRGLWPCKRTVLTSERRVHGPSNLGRPLAALPCGKEPWNINRGTNGFLFHEVIIACLP